MNHEQARKKRMGDLYSDAKFRRNEQTTPPVYPGASGGSSARKEMTTNAQVGKHYVKATKPSSADVSQEPTQSEKMIERFQLEYAHQKRMGLTTHPQSDPKVTGEDTIQTDSMVRVLQDKSSANSPAVQSADAHVWGSDIHKHLVAAIFEIGMAHATPASIAEKMQIHSTEVTSERLKSHLQKFRKRKFKEKALFMDEYSRILDGAEKKLLSDQSSSRSTENKVSDSSNGLASITIRSSDQKGVSSTIGGEAIALLTRSVQREEKELLLRSTDPISKPPKRAKKEHELKNAVSYSTDAMGRTMARILVPTLTAKERASGLGRSLLFIAALAEHMSKFLDEKRNPSASVGLPPAENSNRPSQHLIRIFGPNIDLGSPSTVADSIAAVALLSSASGVLPDAQSLLASADLDSLGASSGSSSERSSDDFVGQRYFPV